jgi:WhiB family redox-sensing transcriptional regulator
MKAARYSESHATSLERPEHWSDRAACAGMDTEIFYPVSEASDSPGVRRAKFICWGCPVRRECLDDALEVEPAKDHGVRGGTTAKERRALRKRFPRKGAAT